jgi:hypothetical protein
MRTQVIQHPAFTPTPEIWMLQVILLIECFGKSRAGQKQHDMSHLFHGMLIKYVSPQLSLSTWLIVGTASSDEATANLQSYPNPSMGR